ncbi:hypothetical protein [Paraburkholderia sp. J94]|uniref:hypothetical protein n=1 Tax=Paraburkholderia sp. J94 TaxID=2805441 RepID=UPI002AB16C1F|nr:hypothetical protein [Paraburkholderia sp. J94]
MKMDDRATYGEIRGFLLNSYYVYCRTKLVSRQQWVSGEYEFGFAYEEFVNAFDTVAERLMLEVLTLVLAAGRGGGADFHRRKIDELIAQESLEAILNALPDDESDELQQDLKLLSLYI